MDFSLDFSNFSAATIAITTLPFLVIALVFFAIGLRGRRASNITRSWPTTAGRVLRSEVELRRRSNTRGGYNHSYYPVVVYEYQVMGQRYQSSTLSPGVEYGLGFQGRVQARVARYPVGSTVQVYYNPANPSEAVLEHSATGNRIVAWAGVFVLVLLACTVAMMLGAFAFAGQFANQILGQFFK